MKTNPPFLTSITFHILTSLISINTPSNIHKPHHNTTQPQHHSSFSYNHGYPSGFAGYLRGSGSHCWFWRDYSVGGSRDSMWVGANDCGTMHSLPNGSCCWTRPCTMLQRCEAHQRPSQVHRRSTIRLHLPQKHCVEDSWTQSSTPFSPPYHLWGQLALQDQPFH